MGRPKKMQMVVEKMNEEVKDVNIEENAETSSEVVTDSQEVVNGQTEEQLEEEVKEETTKVLETEVPAVSEETMNELVEVEGFGTLYFKGKEYRFKDGKLLVTPDIAKEMLDGGYAK